MSLTSAFDSRLTYGQYSHTDDFGLLFYNARWYDPALGRFAQADSIVPNPWNPGDFDRYSYGRNSPTRYLDPDGHTPIPHPVPGCTLYDADGQCMRGDFRARGSVRFTGLPWTDEEKSTIQSVADGYSSMYYQSNLGIGPFMTPYQLFNEVHGGAIEFERVCQTCAEYFVDQRDSLEERLEACYEKEGGCSPEEAANLQWQINELSDAETYTCWGYALSENHILVFSNATAADVAGTPEFVVHEIGHAFDAAVNDAGSGGLPGSLNVNRNGLMRGRYQQSPEIEPVEIFADMMVGKYYGVWDNDPLGYGKMRKAYMDRLGLWLQIAIAP